ncbi:hypothetical protein OIU83_09180 [Flavobacterium sp. LS1R49]|uniref:Uncharacterized protein n=1 Tax=Flavobacterium shii TaxID=2987687 RepID=A0A9X3C763_9FLAO|nr:hypothetical protein [Flavobacterium shii]MCV9927823.1 hypothetical protein [Flavobacterium shii]
MKKQNQIIEKSKLSDLRKMHGVALLANLKVIQGGAKIILGGALLQTPPDRLDSNE